jgi:hypothetical protein
VSTGLPQQLKVYECRHFPPTVIGVSQPGGLGLMVV